MVLFLMNRCFFFFVLFFVVVVRKNRRFGLLLPLLLPPLLLLLPQLPHPPQWHDNIHHTLWPLFTCVYVDCFLKRFAFWNNLSPSPLEIIQITLVGPDYVLSQCQNDYLPTMCVFLFIFFFD